MVSHNNILGNYYPMGKSKNPPIASTEIRNFWQPFAISERENDKMPPRFNFVAGQRLSDIATNLHSRFAGFYIGTEVKIDFVDEELAIDLGSITEVRNCPLLFVPKQRAEVVNLGIIESEHPNLLPIMLEQGITTALRVPGGFIANNPDIVAIVEH